MRVGYFPIRKNILTLYLDRPPEFFELYNVAEIKDTLQF